MMNTQRERERERDLIDGQELSEEQKQHLLHELARRQVLPHHSSATPVSCGGSPPRPAARRRSSPIRSCRSRAPRVPQVKRKREGLACDQMAILTDWYELKQQALLNSFKDMDSVKARRVRDDEPAESHSWWGACGTKGVAGARARRCVDEGGLRHILGLVWAPVHFPRLLRASRCRSGGRSVDISRAASCAAAQVNNMKQNLLEVDYHSHVYQVRARRQTPQHHISNPSSAVVRSYAVVRADGRPRAPRLRHATMVVPTWYNQRPRHHRHRRPVCCSRSLALLTRRGWRRPVWPHPVPCQAAAQLRQKRDLNVLRALRNHLSKGDMDTFATASGPQLPAGKAAAMCAVAEEASADAAREEEVLKEKVSELWADFRWAGTVPLRPPAPVPPGPPHGAARGCAAGANAATAAAVAPSMVVCLQRPRVVRSMCHSAM